MINNPGRYLVLDPPINGRNRLLRSHQRTLLYCAQPRRPIQGLGYIDHLRLYAAPMADLPLGIRLPPCQRSLLVRVAGGSHAARLRWRALHQQRGYPQYYACNNNGNPAQTSGASLSLSERNRILPGSWAAACGFPICERDENLIDIDIMVKF